MSREVLKVYCPRNHKVGSVTADADAGVYVVNHFAALGGVEGPIYPSKNQVRSPLLRDEVAETTAYCKTCKEPVTLDLRVISRKVAAGARDHHAAYSNAIDKTWRQAGREPMYPPDATRRNDDR